MWEGICWVLIGQSHAPATKLAGVAACGLATAACCWTAWRRGQGRWAWGLLAILYMVLLANIRWDLATLITAESRQWAAAGHWYGRRAGVLPYVVAGAMGVLGIGWIVGLCRVYRDGWPAKAAITGGALSLALHLLQMISWHQAEQLLYRPVGPLMAVAWGWLLGAGITIAGAAGQARTQACHPAATASLIRG